MAVHFHPLRIRAVNRETPDCVSVAFEVPTELASLFSFTEGQNVTVRKEIAGEELRRSYSICSAPHENELRVAVKKTGVGGFSDFANQSLKAGDVLDVMPPTGKFTGKRTAGNFLAIAAGSGITPVISIIKETLRSAPGSQFTLLYGNRSRGSIIFFEELEALKNKYMNRFSLVHVLSRERTDAEINYGRINAEKLQALSALLDYKNFDDIFICGPEEMIFSAAAFFDTIEIPKAAVHYELFSTPGQKKSVIANPVAAAAPTGPISKITVKLDGRSFDFDLAKDGESILDAALQQGADLPYACKGGVCATCRAQLLSGEVTMDMNYALEEEEVRAGFILTCQSHPISPSLVVDFDIK